MAGPAAQNFLGLLLDRLLFQFPVAFVHPGRDLPGFLQLELREGVGHIVDGFFKRREFVFGLVFLRRTLVCCCRDGQQ